MGNKAVFFDRDGTLNEDVGYLHRIEDFRWCEGAVEAIRYCNENGYLVIVITNQSGVARGYFTEVDIRLLHMWMNEELMRYNAHIDAFYYCPHFEGGSVEDFSIACGCRKPSSGMVEKACEEYGIDKEQSVLIGDKESDIKCAENACIRGILYSGGSLLEALKNGMLSD